MKIIYTDQIGHYIGLDRECLALETVNGGILDANNINSVIPTDGLDTVINTINNDVLMPIV